MQHLLRRRHIIPVAVAVTVLGGGSVTAAFAGPGDPPPPPHDNHPPHAVNSPTSVSYEVDNGSSWSLSPSSIALANSGGSYEDAGSVVNLGPASSFAGIEAKGSSNLAANVWISNGSEAYSPGNTSLSSPANFCYGLGQANPTTGTVTSFYMTDSACGSDAGQIISASQIATDFAGYQAYGWVGIVSSNSSSLPVSGSVNEVNGVPVHSTLSLTSTTASDQ